jgi:hypothetical protein
MDFDEILYETVTEHEFGLFWLQTEEICFMQIIYLN